jgi:hypothetical protein
MPRKRRIAVSTIHTTLRNVVTIAGSYLLLTMIEGHISQPCESSDNNWE